MAGSSTIDNLNVERLDADPTPLTAGRIWYNNIDKVMRLSSLDSAGAIVVRTFAEEEDMLVIKAVVDQLSGDATISGSVAQQIAGLLGTAVPAALDTLTKLAAALNDDPDIANTLTNLVNVSIANLDSTIQGTADSAMDTFGEAQAAIASITSDLGDIHVLNTANTSSLVAAINEVAALASTNGVDLSDYKTANDAVVSGLGGDLAAEVLRAEGAEGNLANLTTSATGSLVDAINSVKAEAGAGASALTSQLNARVATFDSVTEGTLHQFTHGLSGEFLVPTVQMYDALSGKWVNDQALIELDPITKAAKLVLYEAFRVKMTVSQLDALV